MQILLDENITPKLKDILSENGHSVVHVMDVELEGKEDDEILEWAVENQMCILTQNGKHFIVMVTPKTTTNHHGLFWQRFKLSKARADEVAIAIHKFSQDSPIIYNQIYRILQNQDKDVIIGQ